MILKKSLFLSLYLKSSLALTLAAASDMRDAVQELLLYYPEKVTLVLGSSGNLTQQIINGAPFDVFISADKKYSENLQKLNKVVLSQNLGLGKLALICNKNKIKQTLEFPQFTNKNKIAIANPGHAPYGRISKEFLVNMDKWSLLQNSIIYAENASSATQLTLSGQVDCSFAPVALTKKLNDKIWMIELDTYKYTPLIQTITLLNRRSESDKLYSYLNSVNAKKILKKYEY